MVSVTPFLTSKARDLVTALEDAVLNTTIKAGKVKAASLTSVMPGLNATQRTYQIRKLVDSGMLQPITSGARQYAIGFSHGPLIRGVIKALTDEGFISSALIAPTT